MRMLVRAILTSLLIQAFALGQLTDQGDSPAVTAPIPPAAHEGETLAKRDEAIRGRLSTLWTFVSLNMVAADVLTSYLPGAQEEVIDFAGGEENVKYAMLAGAVIYEIPFSMIFLSKYLPHAANRWTNVGAAALSTFFIVGGGSLEPHYVLMASVETATLAYIAWTALKWPDPEAVPAKKHDFGFQLRPDEGYGLAYAYHF